MTLLSPYGSKGPNVAEVQDTETLQWECPSCVVRYTSCRKVLNGIPDRTPPLHTCRGMKGLSVPFVREGTNAIHVANDREDYVNGELVQTDGEGRPIMSVQTVRDDGEDCTVYAPTATGSGVANDG